MKLSILTINYNNCSGLQRTIESIINQSWKDFEWIVIDGGSNDGSKKLIEKYQNHISYWCSEPDNGVYNAMNKGLSHAHGEWINFMNSGDCFASTTILQEIFSQDYDEEILYGYMMRKTIDGELHNKRNMHTNVKWYDFYFDTLPHQSSFIRYKLFKEFGFYDESYRQLADWKWFANAIVWHQVPFRFIPKKISIYECGGISDSGIEHELERIRKEVFPPSLMLSEIHDMERGRKIRNNKILYAIYRILRKVHNFTLIR